MQDKDVQVLRIAGESESSRDGKVLKPAGSLFQKVTCIRIGLGKDHISPGWNIFAWSFRMGEDDFGDLRKDLTVMRKDLRKYWY